MHKKIFSKKKLEKQLQLLNSSFKIRKSMYIIVY